MLMFCTQLLIGNNFPASHKAWANYLIENIFFLNWLSNLPELGGIGPADVSFCLQTNLYLDLKIVKSC